MNGEASSAPHASAAALVSGPDHEPRQTWRPERCERVALVLQGGGALGAYQAGVYPNFTPLRKG